MSVFGFDHGRPDFDLPNNNDRDALESHADATAVRVDSSSMATPQKESYYSTPVEVCIPEYLSPLPPFLHENPMNLLYFHYFLDYTSKILVTHECSSNPFRTLLPRMAIGDENLLSLLLAYGACHRARLLCHPEPVNRISTWVTTLFPTFRAALANNDSISDTLFGTSVMLASLTLSFPLAFALPISWHGHLSVAQQMLKQRKQQQQGKPLTRAAYFFERWFAYLDTFGSLSGDVYEGCHQEWSSVLLAGEKDSELKCLVGYTNQSLVLLARVADIAKRCDQERKHCGQPSITTITVSQQLRFKLELASLEVQHRRYDCVCSATTPSTDVYRAVNGALCHAALINLHRRVYLLPSNSLLVQCSVGAILETLSKNERYNPIDIPDIILPLFLAGCESKDEGQRLEVLRRLQRIGDAGMSQVSRVRSLIHTCWETGVDWTELEHDILLG